MNWIGKHSVAPLLLAGAVMLGAGCAGRKPVVAAKKPTDVVLAAPPWYPTPPKRDGYLAGSAMAESPDLHVAMSRARLRARGEVAQALELRFQGLLKSFTDQTAEGRDAQVIGLFSETYKVVVNDVLTGSQALDSKIISRPNGYMVFALMELPIGEANRAFVERARSRQELWTRLQASKAFEELDAEIRKWERSLDRLR